ncbi:hypothetical protein FB45DRAFT_1105643 [Roridomyces roridus]|uniref:Uncharacterized protein n=1 Tax=Roridomyces roridus TaxID=1738132 RepID=A0AAD7BC19_9AGAR|nr:hypothetical protein FB45DRAFT_1105643 [Roridomyces roridus]
MRLALAVLGVIWVAPVTGRWITLVTRGPEATAAAAASVALGGQQTTPWIQCASSSIASARHRQEGDDNGREHDDSDHRNGCGCIFPARGEENGQDAASEGGSGYWGRQGGTRRFGEGRHSCQGWDMYKHEARGDVLLRAIAVAWQSESGVDGIRFADTRRPESRDARIRASKDL